MVLGGIMFVSDVWPVEMIIAFFNRKDYYCIFHCFFFVASAESKFKSSELSVPKE